MSTLDELLERLCDMELAVAHYREAGEFDTTRTAEARRDAVKAMILERYAEMLEVLEEVAQPPYPDSDLESLLTTLRTRAQDIIAKAKGE